MHALEKILARHAGKDCASSGEIVECEVDLAGINDLYPQTMYSFYEMGGVRVKNPQNVRIFFDHYAPPSTPAQAENQAQFRRFAQEQGIGGLMEIQTGVCHQVMADLGLSAPGKLMIVTDSHTTMHGAFGAFSTGVGATDCAIALATGKLWFRVPKIIRINIVGSKPENVYAKDIILWIIGQLGADYAIYKGIEFAGNIVESLSVSERMVLCNMSTEMGAKTTYIKPDSVTMAYLEEKGVRDYVIDETDLDFEFEEDLIFDVSALRPQLAVPSRVDSVCDLSEYEGTPIDQAYIGSCTGGRTEDIAIAAKILKGKKIAQGTRLVIVPASQKVLLECIEKHYISDLVQAGGVIVSPGCAACLGVHEGLLASGEVCITTTNRNFPGRMGQRDAKIFLASPAAVAASASAGKISCPNAE